MVVVSISGIRGVVNEDLEISRLVGPIQNFAAANPSERLLVGRDTRPTGPAISRALIAALLSRGINVVDYGVVSTPALFRESRTSSVPAIMITASHNEPEWNGVKFILDGQGITQTHLDEITGGRDSGGSGFARGSLRSKTPSYNRELVEIGGVGGGQGVKVALDLNGGAAIRHAPSILSGIGCKVRVLGGTEGIYSRTIDPTTDGLELLSRTVRDDDVDVGFAFDCDGDRLVLVDDSGAKKTGDFMLTLAVKKMLPTIKKRDVVVSVDTTRAVDDVVASLGGKVYRTKVGEANVVAKMVEMGATLGGEGSSGGLIDGSYNYCRDSMLAAIAITKAIARSGRRVFRQVPTYSQVRLKAPMERRKALTALKRLQKEHEDADMTDGIKLDTSQHSWVLVRVSGTEDAVRVSAEARSQSEAQELADSYLKKVKNLA